MLSRVRSHFQGAKFARMSSGTYCLVRDLGLVKGGKGMRHHEVVMAFSLREALRWLRQLLAGLLPRRFLFAAFHLEPERAAGEAGGVEVAWRSVGLECQHGSEAI